MATVGILAVVLGVAVVYRRFSQPPDFISDFIRRNPDQPKPELVASGMSPALLCLFLAVPLVAIATVVVAWRWRTSH